MSSPALKTLNDSGFPLQVAVHRHIDETTSHHGWKVRYVEHAWRSDADGRSGFMDLVIQNPHGTSFLAVECKRVRDTEWVFLHSDGIAQSRRHVQGWTSFYSNGEMRRFGWMQLALDPACPEAQFCAIRGQSTSERMTLLEKTAAELTLATECLAHEHRDFRRPNVEDLKLFFSVIITTAKLTVARFDPSAISLLDGTLADAKFEEVPFVRFRKQLGVHNSKLGAEEYLSGMGGAYLKESTVFIVNAGCIVDFLREFEVDSSSLRRL